MPQLAIAPTFLNDFSRLDSGVQHTVLTAVRSYLAGDSGRLQAVTDASDPRVRVLQISPDWSGIVAPSQEGSYCLVGVRRHDEAISYARTYRGPGGLELDLVEMPAPPEPAEAAAPVRGPADLADALALPFAEWRLSLDPDHQRLATAHFAGSAQVTGGPGTGKTVLALHRAASLSGTRWSIRQPGRACCSTRVPTAQTLSAQLDRLVSAPDVRRRIEVVTVTAWPAVLSESTGIPPEILMMRSSRWHRSADRRPAVLRRFLVDEWRILAQDLTSLTTSAASATDGCCTWHPARTVWEAIQRYTGAMRAAGECPIPRWRTKQHGAVHPGPRYRHIVVTESQDLHPAHCGCHAAVLEGPDDLFLLAIRRSGRRHPGLGVAGTMSEAAATGCGPATGSARDPRLGTADFGPQHRPGRRRVRLRAARTRTGGAGLREPRGGVDRAERVAPGAVGGGRPARVDRGRRTQPVGGAHHHERTPCERDRDRPAELFRRRGCGAGGHAARAEGQSVPHVALGGANAAAAQGRHAPKGTRWPWSRSTRRNATCSSRRARAPTPCTSRGSPASCSRSRCTWPVEGAGGLPGGPAGRPAARRPFR